MTETGKSTRLGHMLPVVLFVLFFSVCSGILACVFLRAQAVSAQAKSCNAGVQLCRNQAEQFRAGTQLEEGTLTYFYDEAFQPADAACADYYVVLKILREPSAAGNLYTGDITAFTLAGQRLYALDVTVYRPEGR